MMCIEFEKHSNDKIKECIFKVKYEVNTSWCVNTWRRVSSRPQNWISSSTVKAQLFSQTCISPSLKTGWMPIASKPVEVENRWKDVWISVKEHLLKSKQTRYRIQNNTCGVDPGTKPSQSFRISFMDLARTILQSRDLWKRFCVFFAAFDFV